MFQFDEIKALRLGLTGLEADLTQEEQAIQEVAHRFAQKVMRPLGEQLDTLTPEEVIAPASPLWSFLNQLKESGIIDLETLATLSNEQKAGMMPLIFEELGWGDSGLAIGALATAFPAFVAYNSGDSELIDRFGGLIGCWLATQPDRGSDLVDIDKTESVPGSKHNKGNLFARVEGAELIAHQSVRMRVFDMWRKVESSRALSQRVFNYNYGPHGPHLLASITSKTFVTQNAFEVANEALQLFGSNGLTREYPLEKLLRDARAALIEDGENNILSLKGGTWLSKWYRENY